MQAGIGCGMCSCSLRNSLSDKQHCSPPLTGQTLLIRIRAQGWGGVRTWVRHRPGQECHKVTTRCTMSCTSHTVLSDDTVMLVRKVKHWKLTHRNKRAELIIHNSLSSHSGNLYIGQCTHSCSIAMTNKGEQGKSDATHQN